MGTLQEFYDRLSLLPMMIQGYLFMALVSIAHASSSDTGLPDQMKAEILDFLPRRSGLSTWAPGITEYLSDHPEVARWMPSDYHTDIRCIEEADLLQVNNNELGMFFS